jgi:hypothetical protein
MSRRRMHQCSPLGGGCWLSQSKSAHMVASPRITAVPVRRPTDHGAPRPPIPSGGTESSGGTPYARKSTDQFVSAYRGDSCRHPRRKPRPHPPSAHVNGLWAHAWGWSWSVNRSIECRSGAARGTTQAHAGSWRGEDRPAPGSARNRRGEHQRPGQPVRSRARSRPHRAAERWAGRRARFCSTQGIRLVDR